jgi:hypothetical protein
LVLGKKKMRAKSKKRRKNFHFCLSASGGAVQFFFRKDWTAEAGLRFTLTPILAVVFDF